MDLDVIGLVNCRLDRFLTRKDGVEIILWGKISTLSVEAERRSLCRHLVSSDPPLRAMTMFSYFAIFGDKYILAKSSTNYTVKAWIV